MKKSRSTKANSEGEPTGKATAGRDDASCARDLPAWLRTPPTVTANPPVITREQELPFAALTWKNFERLCLRLAEREAMVEHCQLYGVPGQDQEGIDLYARQSFNQKYRVYQCKNESKFSATKIKAAVNEFLQGTWADKADTFILCTRDSLEPVSRANEFERQVGRLRGQGIEFVPWDAAQLSKKLKPLPELVDDFFGREWVKAFCGQEEAERLGDRLDARQVTDFRRRMGDFYRHVFQTQDPGLLLRDAPDAILPLEDRFVLPDVYDRRDVSVQITRSPSAPSEGEDVASDAAEGGPGGKQAPTGSDRLNTSSIKARRAVDEWIASSSRSVILGGPGSGKSTVLRILAIDLLREEPRLTAVARHWGSYLPVWVPFPVWTKMIVERGPSVSLTDMLHQWLSGWDEERLWPLMSKALADGRLLLLVDGLDEWSNEDAARVALDKLQVFIHQHSTPAVVASRPHGFGRLGMERAGWEVADLADFSPYQQQCLARIWYVCRLSHQSDDPLVLQRQVVPA